MNTTKTGRIPWLDTIRGAAILAVFLFHVLGESYGFVSLGWNGVWRDFSSAPLSFLLLYPLTYGGAGVAIFFAVSGFCIHLSHVRSQEQGFGGFYLRRLFRVYPPYLFALLIFFFIYPWGSFAIDGTRMMQLVTHLFLVHNFHRETFFGINASFWSIAVEMQLYLIYPLLLMAAGRFGWRRTMWLCFAIEVPIRITSGIVGYGNMPALIVFTPFAYWLSWSLGAWLAECYLRDEPLPFANWPLWPLLIATFGAGLFRYTAPFGFLLFALTTCTLMAHALSGRLRVPTWPGQAMVVRHLQTAGVVSYSLYLIHQPLLKLVPRVANRLLPELALHPLAMLLAGMLLWWPTMWLSRLMYDSVEQAAIRSGKAAVRIYHSHPITWRRVRQH